MPPLCFCYYISPSLSNEFWLAASIRSENAFPSSVQQSSLPSREHLPSSRSVRAKFSSTPFQKGSFCNFLATVNAKAMFLLLQALRSRISFGFLPSFIQKMPFHRQFSSQACRHANICRHCAASLPAWRKVVEDDGRHATMPASTFQRPLPAASITVSYVHQAFRGDHQTQSTFPAMNLDGWLMEFSTGHHHKLEHQR